MQLTNNASSSSKLVISNDSSSYLIEINKDTDIGDFYQKVIFKYPNLNSIKLYYYEGYSREKLYVSNEEEYIKANKKCIEYFYLCPENSNNNNNNKTDYLKYHSVVIFSPIRLLNTKENNEKRKEMQINISKQDSNISINSDNINYNHNNNMNNNFNMGNNYAMNYNLNMMINNFNMMNLNNYNNNFQMNFIPNNNINNMMNNKCMIFNNNFNNFNMMNNNYGNFNMNNIYNQMMFFTMLNNLKYKNPTLYFQMLSMINPFALHNAMNSMSNNNSNNSNQLQQNQNVIESSSLIPDFETIDTESNPMNKYIENAINFSYVLKHTIISNKKAFPNNFIDIEKTLSIPGLLSLNKPSPNDYKYILCLIGKILKNKDIEVGIYKNSRDKDRIDLASIQFIFSGLINKKKYKIGFSEKIGFEIYTIVINELSERKKFIEEWKTKISKIIKVNKNLIILTNPRIINNRLYMDLAFNPQIRYVDEQALRRLLKTIDINNVTKRPLLEGCRLSTNIFDPKYHTFYDKILLNQKRGGEEYIQPLKWNAYGINVSGKYDFGNNLWLGNKNAKNEFAVAYFGINNLINKNINMMENIMSIMGNFETGKTYVDVKNVRKPGQKCKSGAYFYKNPDYAENSSEIIKIGGFEYKIMFMCRVKTSKIMQPENFNECWILSPTPDEVRPYKILVKKIPKSPLAIQSIQVIKMCLDPSPPQLYFQILQEKDESFYRKKSTSNFKNLSDYDYVLKLYSQESTINFFLRNPENVTIDNKSNVWCLHKAITKSQSNVANGTMVYRGVCFKLPNNIGVGTKFYFPEFLSTSTDINIAKEIAMDGTLMYISILNNGTNGKKVYCRNIEYISDYPFQKEILFTSYCQFKVTKIEKTPNLDIIHLTCEGHNF